MDEYMPATVGVKSSGENRVWFFKEPVLKLDTQIFHMLDVVLNLTFKEVEELTDG